MVKELASIERTEIWNAGLEGRTFIWKLSLEQFAAACNGCGPESWSQEWRDRLGKWLATFLLAFDVHDCRFEYDNDGTKAMFDFANDELEKNCLILADLKYGWYNPFRYFARNRAHLIAIACRVCGWSSWIKAYNKNQKEKEN